MTQANRIFCAIDTAELKRAKELVVQIKDYVGGIKLGLEFYMKYGVEGYQEIAKIDDRIFLDVKLHDIPNTVEKTIRAFSALGPKFITIHTAGGAEMMKAAVKAVKETWDLGQVTTKRPPWIPKLLGVTVLTSLDAKDLTAVGQEADPAQQVLRLAKLAKDSGLDGVICSPEEVKTLRAALADFILMVPGIRPSWAAANDQKRVMTPKQAVTAGASYLVIGRPITGAENPAEAAKRIIGELSA